MSVSNWASDDLSIMDRSHIGEGGSPPVVPIPVGGNGALPTDLAPYAAPPALPSSGGALRLSFITSALAGGGGVSGSGSGLLQGGLPTIREGRRSPTASEDAGSPLSSSASLPPLSIEVQVRGAVLVACRLVLVDR